MGMAIRTLPPRLQRFTREYLANGYKPAEAAKAALGTNDRKVALAQAKRWLLDSQVQRAIRQDLEVRAQHLEINANQVMQELALLADSNIQDLYDETGQLVPIHKLPRRVTACIREVEERETIGGDGTSTIVRKYKLYDRLAALDKMARALSLFADKSEETGDGASHMQVNLQIEFIGSQEGRKVDSKGVGAVIDVEPSDEPLMERERLN